MSRRLMTLLLGTTPRRPGEILRSTLGVGLGVLAVGAVSGLLIGKAGLHAAAIAAPIASSAVLVFAIPASPLAQPRAVVGGNVLAAIIGVWFGLAFPHSLATGAAATGLSVAVMLLLGCLHPPSAAVAFMAASGATTLGWSYVVTPIGLCSALVCLAGALYAPVVRRAYPHPPPAVTPREPAPTPVASGPTDPLAATCGAVMSRDLFHVAATMEPEAALAVLTEHGLRAAPVLDARGQVLGLVRRFELVSEIDREAAEGAGAGRLVAELVDPEIATATPDVPLATVLPWLVGGTAHEVVVVDAEGRALGVITQTDALAALWRAGQAAD